jgi:hypothetical protein
MNNFSIQLILKLENVEYLKGFLRDFFRSSNSLSFPVYIAVQDVYPEGFSRPDVVVSYWQVVEQQETPYEWSKILAQIRISSYPGKVAVFFEGVEGISEEDWGKVEQIVRRIYSKLKDLEIKVESVDPPTLIPESNLKPWERIPDHYSDRKILEYWYDGESNTNIAPKVGLDPRSVTNIISSLRTKYGDEIVPTNEKRKKKTFKNS